MYKEVQPLRFAAITYRANVVVNTNEIFSPPPMDSIQPKVDTPQTLMTSMIIGATT